LNEEIPIYFNEEDVELPRGLNDTFIPWIDNLIKKEGFEVVELNYIFCSDEYLLHINQQYLEHDYYTDVITFDNSDNDNEIEGDIFISVERVKENAKELSIPFLKELKRVMAHGVLHLCGYGDKTAEEIELMRKKEDDAIKAYKVK
jgi:rRNA maturation RNase YbeY